MPYEQIEQIGDRSEERFALGLGAQQLMGLLCGLLPMLWISGSWPIVPRMVGIISAMLIGFVATMPIQGLAAYAWLLWCLRGWLNRFLRGSLITSDDLPGMAQPIVRAPMRVGGPIRMARRASVRITPTAVRMVPLHETSMVAERHTPTAPES